MTTDCRALCAELLDEVAARPLILDRELIDRARAALAEPVPEGLTDQELLRCAKIATPCYDLKVWERELNMMRAAIAADRSRWGRPAAAPVPESERLPGAEDCDAEGRCWWLIEPYPRPVGPGGKLWSLCRYFPGSAHWLPAHALPLPPDATNA